ncbi:MAG: LysR family transcriptional regulator [Pseudomonadales bacterium]
MNTTDLKTFLCILQTGSISVTADQLSQSPAAVSYALKRLEQQLEAQLFVRSTRALRVTAAGEHFAKYARQALDVIEQGMQGVKEGSGLSGLLSCSLPSDLGRNWVVPWLDELLATHPELSLDVRLGDSLVDFYAEQVDVALRYGAPKDSSLVAFEIASVPRITCASTAYIARCGAPKTPSDLMRHQCLVYRRQGRLFDLWHYSDGEQAQRIAVSGRRISDDTDVVRRWALAGEGIIYRSALDVQRELQAGQLQPLLVDYSAPPLQLYLYCASRHQVSSAVIALRDLLRERCAQVLNAY